MKLLSRVSIPQFLLPVQHIIHLYISAERIVEVIRRRKIQIVDVRQLNFFLMEQRITIRT